MAVPKKRTSKSKSRSRKSLWMNKAIFATQKSLSLAKSLISGKSTNFIYAKSLQNYK
uniref:Large ribosomal subunit protein bL32c n=1 Tax=Tolypiocladia glomerulata TaxID=860646 RepID=A0A1Z1MUW1_9FLOR|nr:ribosomal protein L32 [Tolypiocladia glomerulata]ARW69659.1 ribosomal protein L32 [Tolypiocladia glomerulata]